MCDVHPLSMFLLFAWGKFDSQEQTPKFRQQKRVDTH